MPEHYTKSTVSAAFWCKRCARETLHRVDGGRRGPCYVCMEALENTAPAAVEKKTVESGDLFAGVSDAETDAA